MVAATTLFAGVATATSHPSHVGSAGQPPRAAAVGVAVANVWATRGSVRPVDAPSMSNPVHLGRWLSAMTETQRRDLGSRLQTQVRYGDRVVVQRTVDGWSRVRIPDQTGAVYPDGIIGWVPSRQLASRPLTPTSAVATVTVPTAPLTVVAAGAVRRIQLSFATTLPLVRSLGRRLVVATPGAGVATLPAVDAAVHAAGTPAIAARHAAVVAQAKRFLGLPYLWAGDSAWGFDCSGYVSTMYAMAGVTLPRDAADQSLVGRPVARTALRKGDLVYFSSNGTRSGIHHVAMYAGNGWILQAPETGASIEYSRLWHMDLTSQFWGATDPLAQSG